MLDEILARLNSMSDDELKKVVELKNQAIGNPVWIPNTGPQTDAYLSEADELFYGGQAGGGKSDLILGLSFTSHNRSLLIREFLDDARDLAKRAKEIIGHSKGFNAQLMEWSIFGKLLEFGGCRTDQEKERFKGKPHDLIAFDEISDFTESIYRFIITWNRSSIQGQRTRVVATGNPPTRPEGLWVIKYWGAWLDPKHPNPAKEGELRWYTTIDDEDVEVDGRGPHIINGEQIYARSRTFIRAKLSDNPYLGQDYEATLAALPEVYRRAYRDGRFDLSLEDAPFQVIPTSWVNAAMQRWKENPNPPAGVPMCAMGCDMVMGGKDEAIIAPRYDYWFDKFTAIPGKQVPDGNLAGHIITNRKDNALIVIDMGGGYGGATWTSLTLGGIDSQFLRAYKGAEAGVGRSRDKTLPFTNKRTQAYWMLREALDPSQLGGSPICLPDDRRLLADLTAPTFQITSRGIKVEPKEDVVKRLGYSPDRGDAVAMCWIEGQRGLTPIAHRQQNFKQHSMPSRAVMSERKLNLNRR